MQKKFLCIHGHFYQPPRENPWLEAVELQDSAYPYHDWNERITAECYAPNATARIMDGKGRIDRIVNNYSKISFNFGPTLLAWLRQKFPSVHQAIVEADELSRRNFSGHGSAIAQAYNHMIMPLAGARDKQTQILWGIRDFEFRFGRKPEGMWLPETAADLETFDVLVKFGIKFTILSPFQAKRVRRMGGRNWRDVNGGHVDPTTGYEVKLPSGKSITVFFYDGPISQAIAFERLLANGERLANRFTGAFSEGRTWNQLVHIATDGESYGHHHRHGEMGLAYALQWIERQDSVQLTNYGEYLEKHPPIFIAEIHDKSAWSCPHGVERWKSHCGCNSGGRPGWNQHWRAPLRESLDWLRDQLAPRFEAKGREFFKNPWEARDDYIFLIFDRGPEKMDEFFRRHGLREFNQEEHSQALELLEMQRHAMLMYTSCGWFFDELSGIETVQIIQYAARAIQLARDVFGTTRLVPPGNRAGWGGFNPALTGHDLEPRFLEILSKAKSNLPEHRDGREIYKKFARPAMVDLEMVGGHYAVSSLFEKYPDRPRVYAYSFDQEQQQVFNVGRARLAVGHCKVRSEITHRSLSLIYGVLHLGDHNIDAGVRAFPGEAQYETCARELDEAFSRADFPEVIRLMDRHFGESNYSLKNIFRDEQRKILSVILDSTTTDLENRYRLITDQYTPLMRFLGDLNSPLPKSLQTAAEFILNADLRRQLENERPDFERVQALLAEARAIHVGLDTDSLAYGMKGNLDRMMETFAANPEGIAMLEQLEALTGLINDLPFEVNLWKLQNLYHEMRNTILHEFQERARSGIEESSVWVCRFKTLGRNLGFRIESVD